MVVICKYVFFDLLFVDYENDGVFVGMLGVDVVDLIEEKFVWLYEVGDWMEFFSMVVCVCKIIIVFGGIFIGKMIFFNVLLWEIDFVECFVLIEDMLELVLWYENVIGLVVVCGGFGEVNVMMEDLLIVLLWLWFDWIIFGEFRGIEVFMFLCVINMGYLGLLMMIYVDMLMGVIE